MTAPALLTQPDDDRWGEIGGQLPSVAASICRYLEQMTVSLRPSTIQAIDGALRMFCEFLIDHRPDIASAADIDRDTIEDFKVHLASYVSRTTGKQLAINTVRQRLRLLKGFFDRVIEWDWPDAPRRNPIVAGDVPPRPDPLP